MLRLHLGQVCKKPIKTAAATIILAQRKKGDFLPNDQIKKLEAIGGEACLRTLSKVQLDEAVSVTYCDIIGLSNVHSNVYIYIY